MKLDIKKTGDITRDLEVEVSADSLKDIRKKALNKINKEIAISGFRKGKAPLDLIEKRFPEQVKSNIIEEAVPFYYNKAVSQNNLQVISKPLVKDAKYQDGKLFFTAVVELKPQVDIESKFYTNIKLKNRDISVEDKERDKYIDDMRDNIAKTLDKGKEEVSDDVVFKWAGYANHDELGKSVTSEIYLNKIVQRRKETEKQITDHLLSKVEFTLPQSILEEQKKRMMDSQLADLSSRGVPEEEIKKHYSELSKRVDALVKDQVKLYYILESIAEKEKLKYNQSNIYQAVLGFILTQSLQG